MTKTLILTTLAAIISFGAVIAEETKNVAANPAKVVADSSALTPETKSSGIVYAYYFHGDVRCATCIKLEEYSREALASGFEKELTDSTLIWQAVNYDDKANAYFIDDYQLYTKALILSRHKDGREAEWKNLDKIWELVRNKVEYIKYVQAETKRFLEGETADE